MMTVTDLARELGISVPQARRRLEALSRYLNGHLDGKVARGPRGKLLLHESVAALLRDAENLARESGITFSEALRHVAGQLNGAAESSREDPAKVVGGSENINQAQLIACAIIRGAGLVAGAILIAGVLVALALKL